MYSTFFKRMVLGMFLGLSLSGNWAAAQEYLYEVGGMLGGAFYMGDANRNAAFRNMNPAVGAVFRYNANFRIAIKADLAWARVSGSTDGLENVFPEGAQAAFERNVVDFGGQLEFNFFPYSDKYRYLNTKSIAPYICAGVGASLAPDGGETFFSPHVLLGTGVKYKLKNRINVGAELSIRKLFGDGLDTKGENRLLDNPYGIDGSALKNKDWYSMLMISLTYDFGLRNCNCNKSDENIY